MLKCPLFNHILEKIISFPLGLPNSTLSHGGGPIGFFLTRKYLVACQSDSSLKANLVRLFPFISHSWFLAQCPTCSRCSINNNQMNVRSLELLLVDSFKGSYLDSHFLSGTGHLEYCPNYPFIFLYLATPLFSLPGSGPPLRELFGLAHPRRRQSPKEDCTA